MERARRDDRLEVGRSLGKEGFLDGEPVRVGRDHDELAGLEPDEDPRQHGPRLVARRRLGRPGRRSRAAPRGRSRAAARRPSGRRGKSSALKTCRRELYDPETIWTVPSSGLYSSVTSLSGSSRASSANGLPGITTAPSPSTCRFERRPQRELHVGGGQRDRAALGGARIPESTCTVPRVDTARETMPSFATSSSRATSIFRWVPGLMSDIVPSPAVLVSVSTSAPAVSISIVLLNPLVAVIGSVDDGEDGIQFPSRAVCPVRPAGGENVGPNRLKRVSQSSHRIQPACLIRAVSSCTRLYTERSSRIIPSIFAFACITVVWSRPPNSLPILGSDESVRARERYIATWRG